MLNRSGPLKENASKVEHILNLLESVLMTQNELTDMSYFWSLIDYHPVFPSYHALPNVCGLWVVTVGGGANV